MFIQENTWHKGADDPWRTSAPCLPGSSLEVGRLPTFLMEMGIWWLQDSSPTHGFGFAELGLDGLWPMLSRGPSQVQAGEAERRRIDAFELWCWRRLLRVPWTARRSNQSIVKEIGPGISLEGMMLKLKLQYFGHLMRRVDSLEKTDAGRDWGQEEKGTT